MPYSSAEASVPGAVCALTWHGCLLRLIHPALLLVWMLISPAVRATDIEGGRSVLLPVSEVDIVTSEDRAISPEPSFEVVQNEMPLPERFEPEVEPLPAEKDGQGTDAEISDAVASEPAMPVAAVQPESEAWDGDRQRLFDQVFGEPQPGQSKTVLVPWRINQKRQGEMGIQIGTTPDDISWNASSFLQQLGEAVQPELREQLDAIAAQGSFSIEALRALNIEAQFNPQKLTLDIALMPEQLRTNIVVGNTVRQRRSGVETVDSAAVSGYVNVRSKLGWDWLSDKDETGRQPLNMSWDGVFNVGGWAMEGRLDFSEDGPDQWRRGDLRMVRDWPALAMRAQAGEISTPTTGYQRGQSILGLSASRQFSIRPDRVTRPVSNYEFFLEAPSEVEIYINGIKDQTLDLPAGTQDLRDLSLGAGVNDIELIITDPVGRVQQLRFFAPVTSQLLAPGIQTFSYSLGMPVTKDGNQRVYGWDAPLLTAAHRWGLTDTLTSGSYLQASVNQQLVGWDGLWATPLGSFDWDTALSRDPDSGLGYAGKLSYEYRRAGDAQERALILGMEYRSPDFLTVGEDEPNNDIALESRLTYRQKLFGSVRANAGVRYQWGRNDRDNAYRANLSLSRPVGLGRTMRFTLSHEQRANGTMENQAKVNFSMALEPMPGHRLRLSSDADQGGLSQQRLNWNYRPSQSFGHLSQGASLTYRPDDWDASQRLAWRSHRAEASLRNRMKGATGAWLSPEDLSSELTLGSAIAFADGRWGLSRPINGSFAMLVAHPTLRGIDIDVNPSSRGAGASINRWGSAVLPGLSDYRSNVVNLDAPELPLGYSLGRSNHRVRPSYRRGALITVGQDATVFLRGILQDAAGVPVELATGEVISRDDPDWKPVPLFTNRVGKFAVEGFKPGHYDIRLTGGGTATFTIPPEATGLYKLDAVRLEPAKN